MVLDKEYKDMFFNDFLRDANSLLDVFKKSFPAIGSGDVTALKNAHRAAHSLKGLAAMMDEEEIRAFSKKIEDALKPLIDQGGQIDRAFIDQLMASYVEIENRLKEYAEKKGSTLGEISKEKQEGKHGSQKILIVEDTVGIAKALKYRLEKRGFNVNQAFDGEEAMEKIPQFNPDVILLDAYLPKLNGIDICRKLRADEKYKKIIIIMISASEENKTLSEEAGARDFMLKPYDPEELIEKIKKYLGE
ncbi:MAG: response regulator [Candidatus Omnitrophica bacterium]|nr:response regulator [Candidatus Omnitrophota bacterium]